MVALALVLTIGAMALFLARIFAGDFETLREMYHDDTLRLSLWLMVIAGGGALYCWLQLTKKQRVFPASLLDSAVSLYTKADRTFAKFRPLHLVLAPFALLHVLMLILFWDELPWMSDDSWEYLGFAPWRTFGYPLILRLIAMVSTQPQIMIAVQLSAALVSTFVFIEAVRRTFGRGLLALATGIFLFVSWPWFYYSYVFLPEQLFFSFLTLFFALSMMSFIDQRRLNFVGMALAAALCIFIRPAGIFIIFTIPYFYIALAKTKLRVTFYFVLPFVLLLLAQSLMNNLVYGYAGLSNFSGVAMAPNTLFLLKSDLSSKHPVLVRKLASVAEKYRRQILANTVQRDTFDFVRNAFVPMTHEPMRIANDYLYSLGADKEDVRAPGWFKNTSPLNDIYERTSVLSRPGWNWNYAVGTWSALNRVLEDLAVDVHIGNVWSVVKFTSWKLAQGWREVIPFFSMRANLGPNQVLDFKPNIGTYKRIQAKDWFDQGTVGIAVKIFDVVTAVPFVVSLLLPLPVIVLISAAAAGGRVFWQFVKRRQRSKEATILAFAAICLILFHLEVAFAHIGLTRYLTTGMPFAVLLALSPLTLIKPKQAIDSVEKDGAVDG